MIYPPPLTSEMLYCNRKRCDILTPNKRTSLVYNFLAAIFQGFFLKTLRMKCAQEFPTPLGFQNTQPSSTLRKILFVNGFYFLPHTKRLDPFSTYIWTGPQLCDDFFFLISKAHHECKAPPDYLCSRCPSYYNDLNNSLSIHHVIAIIFHYPRRAILIYSRFTSFDVQNLDQDSFPSNKNSDPLLLDVTQYYTLLPI